MSSYAPHGKKLFLSSGALQESHDPSSGVRKEVSGRSKAAVSVKEIAKRKIEEELVEDLVKRTKSGDSTPRKKVFDLSVLFLTILARFRPI